MTSKASKAKRKAIPTFTIAELEEAGRLPPYSWLMDPADKWAAGQERKVSVSIVPSSDAEE